jgi:hypothetical protein
VWRSIVVLVVSTHNRRVEPNDIGGFRQYRSDLGKNWLDQYSQSVSTGDIQWL